MLALFRQQPRPFYMIFMLEVWERFGFYTVQGIMVLYFIRFLKFEDEQAYQTFGAFFALVYGLVAVGGYLGDQVLGTKRTILLGLVVLALGYGSLALSDPHTVYYALGLICVGNGLFKANPSSLLSRCYTDPSSNLHAGFTLYYMAINLGSIFALFIGPAVSSHFGYSYAFLISSVGICMGIVNYWFQRRSIAHVNNDADLRVFALWKWCGVVVFVVMLTVMAAYLLQHIMITKWLLAGVVCVILGIYFYYMSKEPRANQRRMILALVLIIEGVLFFTLYQQMPTSINLFAVKNVYPSLWGIPLDPQSFQVLNPLWIIIMSPVLAQLYAYLKKHDRRFSIPYKFAVGMFFCGLSFLILYLPRFFHDPNGMVSSNWLVASYFLQSLGELLVSALGVAMVAELLPERIVGFVMGIWYLTSAIAGFTGAAVASFTALPRTVAPGVTSLMTYTHVFADIGLAVLVVACVLWLLAPKLERLSFN